jgi:hypothetical protein
MAISEIAGQAAPLAISNPPLHCFIMQTLVPALRDGTKFGKLSVNQRMGPVRLVYGGKTHLFYLTEGDKQRDEEIGRCDMGDEVVGFVHIERLRDPGAVAFLQGCLGTEPEILTQLPAIAKDLPSVHLPSIRVFEEMAKTKWGLKSLSTVRTSVIVDLLAARLSPDVAVSFRKTVSQLNIVHLRFFQSTNFDSRYVTFEAAVWEALAQDGLCEPRERMTRPSYSAWYNALMQKLPANPLGATEQDDPLTIFMSRESGSLKLMSELAEVFNERPNAVDFARRFLLNVLRSSTGGDKPYDISQAIRRGVLDGDFKATYLRGERAAAERILARFRDVALAYLAVKKEADESFVPFFDAELIHNRSEAAKFLWAVLKQSGRQLPSERGE